LIYNSSEEFDIYILRQPVSALLGWAKEEGKRRRQKAKAENAEGAAVGLG